MQACLRLALLTLLFVAVGVLARAKDRPVVASPPTPAASPLEPVAPEPRAVDALQLPQNRGVARDSTDEGKLRRLKRQEKMYAWIAVISGGMGIGGRLLANSVTNFTALETLFWINFFSLIKLIVSLIALLSLGVEIKRLRNFPNPKVRKQAEQKSKNNTHAVFAFLGFVCLGIGALLIRAMSKAHSSQHFGLLFGGLFFFVFGLSILFSLLIVNSIDDAKANKGQR